MGEPHQEPIPPCSYSSYMPGEWSPHDRCIILFPHNPDTFRLGLAQEEVWQVAKAIGEVGGEPVLLLLCHEEKEDSLWKKPFMDDPPHWLQVHVCPSDDTWARDTAPTFVIVNDPNNATASRLGLDWDFNAYGGPEDGCYWPCDQDRQLASRICRTLQIPSKSVPLIMEGGSFHSDGEGTLLTTSECLLHPNRNPSKTKEEIETILRNAIWNTNNSDANNAPNKVIWLPFGVAHDNDTNGHVDNLACFSKPAHVILSWCDDEKLDPENYKRCRAALEVLEQQTDAKGRSFTVHKLLLPTPMYYTQDEAKTLKGRTQGERLAASYVNFYIANKAVIVPQFGHAESDQTALETLKTLFPTRKVVGVPSREILLGGGNIHCITQQLPAVPR